MVFIFIGNSLAFYFEAIHNGGLMLPLKLIDLLVS